MTIVADKESAALRLRAKVPAANPHQFGPRQGDRSPDASSLKDCASQNRNFVREEAMQTKSRDLALLGLLLLATCGASSFAQNKKLILKPPPPSDPTSGAQMYKDYCAACHGPQGKGNGPASEFLKSPLSDLTTLAQRNHGKYPDAHVQAILRFGTKGHAHGTADMPIWGDLFRSSFHHAPDARIYSLTSYLASIQNDQAPQLPPGDNKVR